MLTDGAAAGTPLLPSLEYLDHEVEVAALTLASLAGGSGHDLVLVDATGDLRAVTSVCRHASVTNPMQPVVVVVDEGRLAALKASWGFDDWMLPTASPAEVETRLRVARDAAGDRSRPVNAVGDLVIDEDSFAVRVGGQPLDLTYKEFELLKALADAPNRVFSREVLLSEVWGYDYYGGSRTIDVHIRRLRAKLGPEYDGMIQTVRGVGYRLVPAGR